MRTLATLLLLVGLIASPLSSAAEPTPHRQMAITLDDLPQSSTIRTAEHRVALNQRLLYTLLEAKVPAMGFVNGAKCYNEDELVEHQRQILVDWVEAGFELGNHTWSHPDYNRLTLEEFVADLERGENFVAALMGERAMRWFRHPYLHRGDTDEKREALEKYIAEKGYREAVVSIDNAEWVFASAYDKALKAEDPERVAKIGESYVDYMMDVVAFWEGQSQALFGRNISHVMLMHGNTINADHLGEILRRLTALGYEFIPLAEALEDPAYETEDRFTGRAGISWIHRWSVTQDVDPATYEGEPVVPDWVEEGTAY